GDRLGVLVAVDDGHAVQGAVAVDEVLPARGAHVGDVRAVGECDVAVRRTDRATAQCGVTVPVVPGAELAGRGVVAVGVGATRRHDDVLGGPVERGGGVAEVGRRVDGFHAELVAGGLGGRGGALVHPHAREHAAGGVGHVLGVARRAALRVHRDAIAVLGHHARPQFTAGAQALVQLLLVGRLAGRVTGQGDVAVAVGALGAPLRAVEDHVDALRAGGDADPVDPAAVVQVIGEGVPWVIAVPPQHLLLLRDGRHHAVPVGVV